ncbi:beta-propeller domain-containing protein [Plantactinospora sp. B6F1]|uniref:beta-propeller domain-containing protein n=1 Tax=Plantactinospora sp. B6F1 TaxID=3158971 RepID=UPI0032D8F92E
MTRERGTRSGAAVGTALVAGLALVGTLLSGCTSEPEPTVPPPPRDSGVPADGLRLVAFDSCASALAGLRSAAKAHVGPYGLPGGALTPAFQANSGAERAADADAGVAKRDNAAAPGAGSDYSGTNTHEAGVDEPDLVKTDGRRIVTVDRGILRVIDPASRRLTGTLKVSSIPDFGWADSDLLLHGDRALVLVREHGVARPGGIRRGEPDVPPADDQPQAIVGPRLILVDLTGAPKVIGDYRIDGGLIDARQVGPTVRVVVRSWPRLDFPLEKGAGPVNEKKRLAANRKIVEQAPIDAWLPRYQTSTGGQTSTGRVGCDRLSRPAVYSGASLITLLSFDLGAASLGDGDPVSVAADGDTVYSNGSRLYLASDQRWRVLPALTASDRAPDPKDEQTHIYQFDISGPDRPRYVTAATVPGWLINQYAMSEWDGHLRVATTSGRTWGPNPRSSSAVYVLRADGRTLTEAGRVTGLGKGERIYSVRFAQGIGYVVTFRQTDPLYTVDLRDPRAPKVTGELKITGYSSYLHPLGDGRLIGIGQEADQQGRTKGSQISLFDVSDPTRPTRIAQHHVRYGHSEAEFDPHAFLYWPATNTLVVPVTTYEQTGRGGGQLPIGRALVLRVADGGFTETGVVEHPAARSVDSSATIRRSLMVDGVLWTVSDGAIKATDPGTLGTLAVIRI